MASPSGSSVPTVNVCLTCGDKGESELLIYCRICRDSAVHQSKGFVIVLICQHQVVKCETDYIHYCMDNFSPDDDNINWWCWDCVLNDSKADPLKKSERISSKRQKVLKTRKYWKEKLNQNKRLVQTSNGINKIAQLTNDGQFPVLDPETQHLNERTADHDISEQKRTTPEIAGHSEGHNESVEMDDHTLAPKKDQKQKKIETANSQEEGKTINLEASSMAIFDHCITSNVLYAKPSLELDDCLSAKPVMDPIWRGWFNIKEDSEISVEILAHLSNKACFKVSEAASALPPMIEIQLLDKRVAWPKSFRVSPPTVASIALYFFPACERDERLFDILLDELIERDLALKTLGDNVELLIFSSRELPLQNWRYKSKYFLWGVFKQKQRSRSSTETTSPIQQHSSTKHSPLPEPTVEANNKLLVHLESTDHLSPPSQPNQSPMSLSSSQASNMLPSKHSTPDSRSSPCIELNRLDKMVEQDHLVTKNSQCEEQNFEAEVVATLFGTFT
ncbi:hypothetical protein Sango_1851800 [Sesamum angolense]|uniref:AIPP2-like SPOC-like domain-containing protein n=1 Tax=Sesamum angolense TaxID=2727404 RepID=A0AAE1WI85_9LAMI|nr:hypothetical protein Sango_1851800 [Sesamum angolense]